jgi:hypothetical protein
VTADGIVGKIRVRLNANTKSRRCEEIMAQKKSMHLASFRFLVEDVLASLLSMAEERGAGARLAGDPSRTADLKIFTVEGLVNAVHRQCLEVLKKHEERPAVDYAKDSVYRVLVTEALDVKAWAVSKFLLWLEDESQFIFHVMNRPLRVAHRDHVAFLKTALRALGGGARCAAALGLCKMRGLVEESVEEVNEVGEDSLTCAAADGQAAADLGVLIAAAGIEEPFVDPMVSPIQLVVMTVRQSMPSKFFRC